MVKTSQENNDKSEARNLSTPKPTKTNSKRKMLIYSTL